MLVDQGCVDEVLAHLDPDGGYLHNSVGCYSWYSQGGAYQTNGKDSRPKILSSGSIIHSAVLPEGEAEAGGVRHELGLLLLVLVSLHGGGADGCHLLPHSGLTGHSTHLKLFKKYGRSGKYSHEETGIDKLLDRNQSEMGKAIGKVLDIFSSHAELAATLEVTWRFCLFVFISCGLYFHSPLFILCIHPFLSTGLYFIFPRNQLLA